jgi:hypothetical protein
VPLQHGLNLALTLSPKPSVYDDAWRSKARSDNCHLMYAWMFPNTTKNKGRIFDTHKREMIH